MNSVLILILSIYVSRSMGKMHFDVKKRYLEAMEKNIHSVCYSKIT